MSSLRKLDRIAGGCEIVGTLQRNNSFNSSLHCQIMSR